MQAASSGMAPSQPAIPAASTTARGPAVARRAARIMGLKLPDRRAAVAGVDPSVMGIGPVPLSGGLPAGLDRISLKPRFAAQALCVRAQLRPAGQHLRAHGSAIRSRQQRRI
jgi:hypothetical protein